MRTVRHSLRSGWLQLVIVVVAGLLLGVVGKFEMAKAQEAQLDSTSSIELAGGPPPCDPAACYHFSAKATNVQVTVDKSDGNCSNGKIIGRVTDYFNKRANGNQQDQSCNGPCGCNVDITLQPGGGTETLHLKGLNVGAGGIFGNCIVDVTVTITYTGGSGTIGHCANSQA